MRQEAFYRDISAAGDLFMLQGCIEAFIKCFAGDFFTCFTMGLHGENRPRHIYGHFGHPWPLHYKNNNYLFDDAALLKAFEYDNNDLPVRWTDIDWMPEQKKVLLEAQQKFDLSDGVVFPITNQNRSLSIFTVAGKEFSPTEEDIACLGAGLRRAHLKALKLLGNPENIEVPVLTPRQNQALFLIANGYSRTSMAKELEISENGVKKLVAEVRRRLNASTVGLVTFEAMRHKLTSLYPRG